MAELSVSVPFSVIEPFKVKSALVIMSVTLGLTVNEPLIMIAELPMVLDPDPETVRLV